MFVPIDLDRPRNLRLDFLALKELENRLGGISTTDIIHRCQALSLNTIAAALYVGLKHEDPTLNPNLLNKILKTYFEAKGKGGLKVLLNAINKSLLECGLLKTDDEEDEDEGEVPGNGQEAAT